MADESDGELVAKAVVAGLNVAGLAGADGDVLFRYHALPTLKLADFRKTYATVRETDEQPTQVSRSQTQHDYSIEICVRRQVTGEKSAVVSQVKRVMQDVREYYLPRSRTLPGRAERFLRVDSVKIMDDGTFAEQLVVKGTAVLIFRGFKEPN